MDRDDDGRCNYSAPVPEQDVRVYCVRPFRHQGPCLGYTAHDQPFTWCGRVCEGCESHGDPDDPVLIGEFTGDVEAVVAGAATIGCLFFK